jgi:ATP-dependent exoDNAse (exonuclease V) alpha subunit
LNQQWSTRRAHINARRGELAVQFQRDHGRPPTPVEALHLAQQATLQTRDAKHEPRSLAEQRSTWMTEATAVLGGHSAVASMVATALTRAAEPPRMADAHWVAQTADRVLAAMEQTRSSAAAAGVLGEQTGIRTDTLAKLTWSLRNGDLPDWATGVGRSTLIIIDEVGMADTFSLDAAVRFAIDREASVRLIGDDQQLAAIGAGGVLRDVQQRHGALQLTELHRFTDRAEAAATLALREGKPEALNFYLDHGRVHVGDPATTTEDAFSAWVSDRAAGLDAIMIAPTRHLVAQLNHRARAPSSRFRCHSRGAVGRRELGQRRRCDHHPQQRPPPPPHRDRLGQKRRPADHHPHQPAR